ncbi:MAG: DUF2252 domain-containing protein [Corynebacterium sp.]|nr:DUF2252 domain-containing protein [Corynebacterium sp.]
MDTKNLLANVAQFGLPAPEAPAVPRYVQHRDGFAQLAQSLATGSVIVPPQLLTDRDRRRHIRNTIIEDHVTRMHLVPEAVQAKLDDLAKDPFLFFRGTALLFHRDLVGSDLHLPAIPVVGDVHPENFGILPGAHGEPIFSVNDLDEAWMAPFTWDVERGAVGFGLAAQQAGAKKKKTSTIVRAFIDAYFSSIKDCVDDPEHADFQFAADDSPKVLRPFFRKAQRDRAGYLDKRIDTTTMTFREDERTHRHPELLEELKSSLNAYADAHERTFRTHDLAIRKGSGTASRGLTRFWFLLEELIDGPSSDLLILEMKMSRPSSIEGLVPDPEGEWLPDSPAERIALAFNTFVKDGDPYYGFTDIAGISFLVRERGPQKVNIDVGVFDEKDLKKYAKVCGRVLGIQHVRADGALQQVSTSPKEPLAQRITAAASSEVFRADTEEFAVDYLKRINRDFELFREDLGRGAFRNG